MASSQYDKVPLWALLVFSFALALTACSAPLASNPEKAQELRTQALAAYAEGRLDNALRDLERLDKEALADFEVLVAMADIHRKKSNDQRAKHYYTKAFESHPLLLSPKINISNPAERKAAFSGEDDIWILALAYRDAYYKRQNLSPNLAEALVERGLRDLLDALVTYRTVDADGIHPQFYAAIEEYNSGLAELIHSDVAPKGWPDPASVAMAEEFVHVEGWDITLSSPFGPKYFHRLGSSWLYLDAEPGYVFALFHMTFRNTSNKTSSFSPLVDWKLYDANGYEYSIETLADIYLPDSARLSLSNVPPNASREGYLIFQIDASNYQAYEPGQFVLELRTLSGRSQGAWFVDEFFINY